MQKKSNLTTQLFHYIKQFYFNEKGVYAVMTALLAFPLLVLIAFTVDGTGILLDKARLAQATEQAALLLIAEDNEYRENKGHSDVSRQNVTQQEIEKEKSFSTDPKLSAQWKKRNQELVQGLVKLYLRSDDSNAQKNSSPVTIKEAFDAQCFEKPVQPPNPNGRAKTVACKVQGSVQRRFWLPWSQTLVSNSQLHEGRIGINSGRTYAIKEKQITIPIDLMMVTDLSGSMKWDIKGEKAPRVNIRIDALRDTVSAIQDILLPKETRDDVSPHNRMGFVSFAAGARQKDDTNNCVLPYYVTGGKDAITRYLASSERRDIDDGFMMIERNLDVSKTINQIDQFNGEKQSGYFTIKSQAFCLGGNSGKKTTQAWFDKKNPNIASALRQITPLGGTAVTSGIFIGVNLMMDKNKDTEAQPDKIKTNTRRVLLILSDGEDNLPSENTLVNLMNNGLCNKIKDKINSLQDSNYPKVETRIAFVALGFNPPDNQRKVWQQCVGDQYYPVNSKQGLLDAFKQIINFEEEVGRSSSRKPDLIN